MKVLWILNNPLSEAMALLSGKPEESHSTGSWVCALAAALSEAKDLQLFTAAPSSAVHSLVRLEGSSLTHFLVPSHGRHWEEIRDRIQPDVVHIHGTEYPAAAEYVKTCGNAHVVVSLQGLVTEIASRYLGGIPEEVLRKYISFRDRIRHDSVLDQKEDILQRAGNEIALLQSVQHVIGRTSWDKKVSLAINPDLTYHFCNEALRTPFYTGQWHFNSCVRHRIFLSQGHYPLKGVHILLEALPAVLAQFPDTTVHIAGSNVLRGDRWQDRLLRNGYGNYLAHILKEKGLEDVVQFIGERNAEGIRQELLDSQVFLSASSIENSPNSLCEAQMIGVPCVASAVGGTPDLIPDASCGILYPFQDPAALSVGILQAFRQAPGFDNAPMRALASARHDRAHIAQNMIAIYEEVAC